MFYNDLCDTIVDDASREAEWALVDGPTIDNEHDDAPEYAYTESVSPFDTPYM